MFCKDFMEYITQAPSPLTPTVISILETTFQSV